MIIDMLLYVFVYTDGSSRFIAFDSISAAGDFAHMEGDHLVEYYIWIEQDG